MGRRTRHEWTAEDVKALMTTVEAMEDLRVHYGKLRRLNEFWAAVSGAIFREIALVVSGSACRARYDLVMAEAAARAKAAAQSTAPSRGGADHEWRRVSELAVVLGVSEKTIRNRANSGKIEKRRVGSFVWVRPAQPEAPPADAQTMADVLAELGALRRAVEDLCSENRAAQASRRGTAPLLAALPNQEGKV